MGLLEVVLYCTTHNSIRRSDNQALALLALFFFLPMISGLFFFEAVVVYLREGRHRHTLGRFRSLKYPDRESYLCNFSHFLAYAA